MRKFGLVCLFLVSLSFAAIRVQGQYSVLGGGVGLGLGMQIIPLLLEAGVEGSTHALPSLSSKGNYEGVPYEGDIKISATRIGGYAKLSIPGLSLIPVLGILANPTLHFGTQSGAIDVDGAVRLGVGNVFADRVTVQGSYALLGFPCYLAWFFIEPAIGAQHIAIPGVLNTDTVDAQISIGASF